MFITNAERLISQLKQKYVLVRQKTIVRVKGAKVWKFDPPMQSDAFQDFIIRVICVIER